MISENKRGRLVLADISKFDQQINEMEIPQSFFEIFGGEKIENAIKRINDQVLELRSEAAVLKKEMGALKGVMQATIQASQTDINEFLKTAGIKFAILHRMFKNIGKRDVSLVRRKNGFIFHS